MRDKTSLSTRAPRQITRRDKAGGGMVKADSLGAMVESKPFQFAPACKQAHHWLFGTDNAVCSKCGYVLNKKEVRPDGTVKPQPDLSKLPGGCKNKPRRWNPPLNGNKIYVLNEVTPIFTYWRVAAVETSSYLAEWRLRDLLIACLSDRAYDEKSLYWRTNTLRAYDSELDGIPLGNIANQPGIWGIKSPSLGEVPERLA